jgi:hypothetical protein
MHPKQRDAIKMKHESTNEPVAWMASDDPSAIESSPPHPELIHQWIPLYTHPQDQKKDEALRLALEALKDLSYYADLCELFLKETHPGKAASLRKRVTKSIEAITLIKQALENK